MPTLRTTVIPKPAPNTRGVVESTTTPMFIGRDGARGDLDLLLSSSALLLKSVRNNVHWSDDPAAGRGAVLHCPSCGAYGEFPSLP